MSYETSEAAKLQAERVEPERKPAFFRPLNIVLMAAALAAAVLHISFIWGYYGPMGARVLHVWTAVLILALADLSHRKGVINVGFALAAVITASAASFYLYTNQMEIISRYGFSTTEDMVAAGIMACWMFYYVWRQFGAAFAVIGAIFLAYAYVGSYMPMPLTSPHIDWVRATSKLTLGSYGAVVELSATLIFIIMMFGAVLQASGAASFVWGVAGWMGKKTGSGSGGVAVAASGLISTFTGVGAANVGITAPMTIPMMKREGYSSAQSAAIEALASTGGQITPPILGLVAFLMAEFIGVPYLVIVVASIAPALIYYVGLLTYVTLIYRKNGKGNAVGGGAVLSTRQLVISGIGFTAPLVTLVALIYSGLSIPYAAFWSIIATLACAAAQRIQKDPKVWLNAIKNTVIQAAGIGVAAGVIDIIMTSLDITQLGMLTGFVVSQLSGESVLGAFLLVLVATYLMGMGMPGVAVYTVVAITLVPILVNMGAEPLVAHFIIMYMIIISNYTPPVAPTLMLTARIAEAPYFRSGLEAMKAGVASLILPFFLFSQPELLFQGGSPMSFALAFAAATASVLFIVVGLVGWFRRNLGYGARALLIGVGAVIWVGTYVETHSLLITGAALVVGMAALAFTSRTAVAAPAS